MPRFVLPLSIFITLLGVTISLLSAHTDSLTFDEIAHIGSGYSYITQNDYRLNIEHPPILKVMSGLFIALFSPHFDILSMPSWSAPYISGEYGQWNAGRLLLHESNNPTDTIVFWARFPFVISFAIFGLFLMYWGRSMSAAKNSWIIGILALVMWTSNPSILGHNHLVTTDIGAAIAINTTLFFFILFLKNPTWKNTALLGIVFGIANAVKFSAFILLPFFVVAFGIYYIIQTNKIISFFAYIKKGTAAIFIALFAIYLIYIPASFRTPAEVLDNITPIKIHNIGRPIDFYSRESILAINHMPGMRPFALYLHGFIQVFHRVAGGNQTYFINTVSSVADPLYFPTVFTIKEPLSYLFLYTLTGTLLAITLLRGIHKRFIIRSNRATSFMRAFIIDHLTESVLLLFIFFYIILAIGGNLTIGIRHLFPIYPALFLLCSAVLFGAYQRLQNKQFKKTLQITATTFSVFIIIHSIHIFPSHLSYFNSFAGGTSNGYHFVVDSNADWGQGTKRLKKFLLEENIQKIHIDYFGGDNLTNRFADTDIEIVSWWSNKRPVEPGFYALSTTVMQDSIHKKGATRENAYTWTLQHTPIAQIDSSILLFHIKN